MHGMSDDWNSRTKRMIGEAGVEKLASSAVCVFGLGGVGSACAEALARAGVGTLIVVDKDDVDPSNINRQVIAFQSTIGRPKVEVMSAMARDINPDIRVIPKKAFVRYQTIDEIMSNVDNIDYIVDALDTLTAKIAIAMYAQDSGIAAIHAMGGANKTDPTKLAFADLHDTKVCPLCRELRKIARKQGIEKMQVLYSCEQPMQVRAQEGAERSEKTELGTMSYFPPIMGEMIASYVIRDLLGML